MKRIRRGVWLAAFLLLAVRVPVQAEEKGPDLRAGVLYGVVLDAETKKPVAGATVAAFDNKGKPIAWGKTDENGRYALVAPPLKALNFEKEGRGGGLLVNLVRGVGKVFETAVDVTVDAARTVAGVTLGQKTAVAARAVVGANGGGGPDDQIKTEVAKRTSRTTSARMKQNLRLEEDARRRGRRERQPELPKAGEGQVVVKVIMAKCQEYYGPCSVYWMEPPVRAKDKPEVGPQAWLEPILLAPAGKKGKSQVAPTKITLGGATIEPTMATPGSTVKISAQVSAPKQEGIDLRVFAVDDRADTVVELKPGAGGRYTGEFVIPEKHPTGETILTLAALRARPVTVDISEVKEDPLPKLAAKLDDLKPKSQYEYDPRVLASHNRLDLKLVVLDPKQGVVDPSTIPTELKPAPVAPPPMPMPAGEKPAENKPGQPPADPKQPQPKNEPPAGEKPAPPETKPAEAPKQEQPAEKPKAPQPAPVKQEQQRAPDPMPQPASEPKKEQPAEPPKENQPAGEPKKEQPAEAPKPPQPPMEQKKEGGTPATQPGKEEKSNPPQAPSN